MGGKHPQSEPSEETSQLGNYSAKEISEILHIPRGTVLSRLAKARENIKKELEGNGYEG